MRPDSGARKKLSPLPGQAMTSAKNPPFHTAARLDLIPARFLGTLRIQAVLAGGAAEGTALAPFFSCAASDRATTGGA